MYASAFGTTVSARDEMTVESGERLFTIRIARGARRRSFHCGVTVDILSSLFRAKQPTTRRTATTRDSKARENELRQEKRERVGVLGASEE
jgi:hypothetical protein